MFRRRQNYPKPVSFPARRGGSFMRFIIGLIKILLLLALFAAAAYFSLRDETKTPIATSGQKIFVADGDSFAIGDKKYRLKGIDAPEYNQTCKDEKGADWQCGRVSHGALEQLLLSPGLACSGQIEDRYHRALAACSLGDGRDIAAEQVRAGMAVSHEYYDVRDFPEEEDAARLAKRGIWRGVFMLPEDYRKLSKAQPILRTNTHPAE